MSEYINIYYPINNQLSSRGYHTIHLDRRFDSSILALGPKLRSPNPAGQRGNYGKTSPKISTQIFAGGLMPHLFMMT